VIPLVVFISFSITGVNSSEYCGQSLQAPSGQMIVLVCEGVPVEGADELVAMLVGTRLFAVLLYAQKFILSVCTISRNICTDKPCNILIDLLIMLYFISNGYLSLESL